MSFDVLNVQNPSSVAKIKSPSSKSPTSSVQTAKVSVAQNWKEYHGANNWVGLLDPLDDTLRSELLRYGKFVQATYNSFDAYDSSHFPDHSLLPLSGHPDTGYEVTCNLHSTSGVKLPQWADMCSSWVSKRSSWIGYVAVCQDDEEIARLGRRDVVISFRGTATCLEWVENLRATLTRVTNYKVNQSSVGPADAGAVMVERGFWSLFSSAGFVHRSLQQEIRDEVGRLLDLYCGRTEPPLSITFTGHSLGASLAVLAAYDVTTTFFFHRRRRSSPHVSVVSFGGPRVGNAIFGRQVEDLGIKILRIVNTRDIVTKVPGFIVDGRCPCWMSKVGLGYSDVGQELRVSCSSRNMADCHDLNVYLELVKRLKHSCTLT